MKYVKSDGGKAEELRQERFAGAYRANEENVLMVDLRGFEPLTS